MNITLKNIDELNAVLKIQFEKQDYAEKVEKSLREHRRKVNMKGFRPGMAPMGLVQKMYGKHVLADEINKLLSESMYNYITKEKLDILGEPLPSETEKSKVDFENETEFEFNLDIAFSSKVSFDLEILKSVPKYKIKIDDEILGKQIDGLKNRFGKYQETEISDENSLLYVFAQELDNEGNIKTGGVIREEASVLLKVIKDEEAKKQFVGKKINDDIIVNVKTTFTNNVDLAGMLGIDKEKVNEINDTFKFTVNKINQFVLAEINQDFYDLAFGKEKVKSEEEMKEIITSQLEKTFKLETSYKLMVDVKDKLLADVKADLPEEFLKRWLIANDKKGELNKEQLDRDFPYFAEDLRWKLMKDFLIKENKIEVTEKDALEVVKEVMAMEFSKYGLDIRQFPEEQLMTFAKERLDNKENKHDRAKFFEKAHEENVIKFLDSKSLFEEKEITLDEFQKFFQGNN